jgi:hypothetical protein
MAKSEGRGWKRFIPSGPTIVKVFVALAVIKVAETVAFKYVPAQLQPWLPTVS